MSIALYDTVYSDCLKWGANMCLCPLQECTMNFSYTMYISILYCPSIIQQLFGTYVLHDIHRSDRLEYFCNLKSYGLRSSADDGYLFLNYICLSICSSFLRTTISSSYLYTTISELQTLICINVMQ